ncbi:replicative DNA helicase [Neobacillus niacini]|uniref:replicative DNA helicase n=1 Tax=Neobacillus niacini TaxID=86668 RepID=UPI003B025800
MLPENNEQALLSCLMKKGDLINEVVITPDHFDYIPNQKIFQAMRRLEAKDIPIDIVSVNTELGQEIIFIGGSDYLSDLYSIHTHEANVKTYERYVMQEYKIRKTKELMKGIEEVHSPKEMNSLQRVVTDINELLEEGADVEFNLSEVLYSLYEDTEKEKEGINGIPTGYLDLDNLLDGLNEEELIILGARPSVGKTAFALGITSNVCNKDHFVDFFSLEMSAKSILTRMISNIGSINSMKMKNAMKRFMEDDWTKYHYAQGVVSSFRNNLVIYDKSKVTVQEIRSKVKQSIRNFPEKRHLVIIDYLTLIQGSGRRERHLEVGEISRNLKRMARDLKVSVLLLSQLSRGLEQRQNKRPMLSDIRDSGEIEQDADKILFLHRDDYFNKQSENKNLIEIIVAKNRNGSVGTVKLNFVKEYNQFSSLENAI